MGYNHQILSLYNNPSYKALMDYYGRTTVFNVLGVERSETRHSAFLCWLLNDKSSHMLADLPLRRFLSLYALKNNINSFDQGLKRTLLVGDYKIYLNEATTEKSAGTLLKDSKNADRLDVYLEGQITFGDADGGGRDFILVIENKVYSQEGEQQTSRYHDILKQSGGDGAILFEVYLSPDGTTPKCDCFVPITYQDLVDYVLEPLLPIREVSANEWITDYVRTLSCPCIGKENKNIDSFTALAVTKNEKNLLRKLSCRYRSLVEASFVAQFESAKGLLGIKMSIEECDRELLGEFWETNVYLMSSLLCELYPDRKSDIKSLLKGSNRGNTKYRVLCDGEPVMGGKFLPKSQASRAIFMAYLKKNPRTTLDELRKAFPVDINPYYNGRYFKYLFYKVADPLCYDLGSYRGTQVTCSWDFELEAAEPDRKLLTEDGEVTCIKMWRKNGFDNLLQHVAHNFKYIQVDSFG